MSNNTAWQTHCPYYADTDKTEKPDGITLSQDGVCFSICSADGFSFTFEALDVLFTDSVKKSDVQAFIAGTLDKVKRANPLTSIGAPKLLSLELEGGKTLYLELKGPQFKQLLSIAQAKQKYSRTVTKSS